MQTFNGSPSEIGLHYGRQFNQGIAHNISSIVDLCKPYKDDPAFKHWVLKQEQWLKANVPWLIEEMQGVAEGSGQPYENILFLNLRVWQYALYGKPSDTDLCSSIAMPLSDGTIACAGAIDDPAEYYCGPVHISPQTGHRFITFPLTGACWASRAHNSAGLSVGISSQHLPGIRKSPNSISQDIAVRIIIQTCSTADDVRAFCKKHPFILNIVCGDAKGEIFACHNTTAGLFEVPAEDGCCIITNHISDDRTLYELSQQGVSGFPEHPTSRARRGRLLEFASSRQSKCNDSEVMAFLSQIDTANQGFTRNAQTIYLTYSNPQKSPLSFWVLECTEGDKAQWIERKV